MGFLAHRCIFRWVLSIAIAVRFRLDIAFRAPTAAAGPIKPAGKGLRPAIVRMRCISLTNYPMSSLRFTLSSLRAAGSAGKVPSGVGPVRRLVLSAVLGLACFAAHAEIVVTDAAGTRIRLDAPARRIVSLAPNITELLFAAGAGNRMVGNVDYGDYPPAAAALPKVGGASLDLEAIVALKPDLVLGWESGTAAAAVSRLRAMGLTVHLSESKRIEDIAGELERIGQLAGTEAVAGAAAKAFRERYARLGARYSRRPPVDVFYQIWKEPLMTVNGRQIISDAIRLCGGRNVFADLPVLAASVTVEAVIAANPEIIVASGMDDARPEWLDDWRRWHTLAAVARDNLYFIPPELIQRHTPRILDGVERLCAQLETARGKRGR
jgi:iron complex transport system substrate-binding protein